VGHYLDPPDRALVLCCDEKSQCQALERTQPGLPLGQGHIRTQTHDYYRHGTVTLFAALDYLSGKVFAHTSPRHRHQEWLAFLRKIDQEIAPEFDLHIICDNYSTHKHAKVNAWLKRHPRFHIHFIPTSSSWLNLVERFFGEITAKVIRPGSFRSVGALVADIFRFLDHHNLNPKPYRWTADPKRILEKLDRAWEALLEEVYNPVYGTSHRQCPTSGSAWIYSDSLLRPHLPFWPITSAGPAIQPRRSFTMQRSSRTKTATRAGRSMTRASHAWH
jgi:transposase